ncbi:MAG: hypothetical protein NDF54_08590 [archaeon GB-1867-035]|nr:hypothetical protein [Candidatus Culexmicrobium profundum]
MSVDLSQVTDLITQLLPLIVTIAVLGMLFKLIKKLGNIGKV